MAAFFYYVFVFPLSLLPLWVIYLFTDFLFLIFISVFQYRKKVIVQNLKNSFPEKSEKEIQQLKRKFYKHFTDILAEGIKNLSISEKELRKRVKVKNLELIEDLYQKNKSVFLVSGHYNNWEWLITSQNFLLPHQAVGIGMPLTSKFWDKKLNERRSRFGMQVINAKTVKEYFSKQHEKPFATLILSDQSPSNSEKAYWTQFLNQQTAVLFGCELLANTYNQAVVFFVMRKVKRGYYELEFELISEDVSSNSWGEITVKHTKLLEKEIIHFPENWIWSHKRWKRQIPENLEELKAQQRADFNKKFAKS
ncbi:MAG: lysophospholipid acyltransferase family protein [Bacteroidota bacterium]